MRSRPVASSPHHGHVAIQSSTPRSQRGQTFWNASYFHVCSRPHQGQNRIGYITPPPQPHSQRRWNLNPLGALSGSSLESSSAMFRPHQGQNDDASETIQPQYAHSAPVSRCVSLHSSLRLQLGQLLQNRSSSVWQRGQRSSGVGTSRRLIG